MAFTTESEPLDTMRSLIVDNWLETEEIPKPVIIVANQDLESDLESGVYSRIDLANDGDYIIIRPGGAEQIRYRGNIVYIDKIYPIALELLTTKDRQRLRNIAKMIRSICLDNKWDFTGWQLIKLLSYEESFMAELNIWRAGLNLQIENYAVLADTLI